MMHSACKCLNKSVLGHQNQSFATSVLGCNETAAVNLLVVRRQIRGQLGLLQHLCGSIGDCSGHSVAIACADIEGQCCCVNSCQALLVACSVMAALVCSV